MKIDISANQGSNGVFHTASVTRSWQDDQQQWHDQKITNLNADALLALSHDAARARDEIRGLHQSRGQFH